MVETITPAGCGSRRRYRIALALFAAGALAAAAALGAVLGLAGAALDREAALGAVAVLALVAAAREAGLLRLPVPGLRRQVPERWRREWPLPAWSLGYGAGLGAGLFTYQPVGTFWVAAAGAVALGDPATSAACLALFGAGRAAMVALPSCGGRDASAAVGRLAAGTRLLRPANAAGLAAVAALVGSSTALAQGPAPVGRLDPALWGDALAAAETGPGGQSVIVRAPGRPELRIAGARSPSIARDLLAVADDQGIRVLRWTTGEDLLRIPGPVGRPALDWPRIAFVREGRRGATLELLNAISGARRVIARAGRAEDLGRPALRGGLIAWHRAAARNSRVLVRPARRRGRTIVVASSATAVHVNPSLAAGHVAWVESRGERSSLRVRRVGGGPVRTILTLSGPDRLLWTTALSARRAYVTRWSLRSGRAALLVRSWRPAGRR